MFKFTKITLALILFFSSTHIYSATINTGDLLITELMSNPMLVSDTNGEWFEIFNASANAIELNGITISDDGGNLHEINNTGSLLIQAGDYFVLGRNGDTLSNGGYNADYVYNNFTLGNASDQIILSKNSIEIARLNYSGSTFGSAGTSAELIFQSSSPSLLDYQLTPQNFIYGLGDIGTPGAAGSFSLTHASPVPIPSALWLLISGVALLYRKTSNSTNRQQIRPI